MTFDILLYIVASAQDQKTQKGKRTFYESQHSRSIEEDKMKI